MNTQRYTKQDITALFDMPFVELVFQAQSTHRNHFKNNEMELCTLLSVKTGACPEDCAYCPQSGHYNTGLKKEKLMDVEDVLAKAKLAKENGAQRFCMGAAWKNPPEKEFPNVIEMVKRVRELGLETCLTLGMLNADQAKQLSDAGLDYYNHNLDTSPDYYKEIISTRTYQDRLDTLAHVRDAGINVCCGGIVGMGEALNDRVNFLWELYNLPKAPESVPINKLIAIPGTPLADAKAIDDIDFVRMIAVARIVLPTSKLRLSAGRESMSDTMQTLCFMAGANSIHFGEKLLVTKNADADQDLKLLSQLGFTCSPNVSNTACST
jgi:biotin synthase